MEKISQQKSLNVYAHHYHLSQLFELLHKGISILVFLVTPEDTSEEIGNNQFEIKKYHKYEILGGIKALFWLVISFAFALLICQLK
jgi:hypothetical protein